MYVARLSTDGIVERVVLALDPAHAATLHGPGLWTPAQPTNYPGVGWWYDGERFWPWRVDPATGTLWLSCISWDAVAEDDRIAFVELTGLTAPQVGDWIVFGGRPITDEDLIALAEVLP